jgi:hypothetical protein
MKKIIFTLCLILLIMPIVNAEDVVSTVSFEQGKFVVHFALPSSISKTNWDSACMEICQPQTGSLLCEYDTNLGNLYINRRFSRTQINNLRNFVTQKSGLDRPLAKRVAVTIANVIDYITNSFYNSNGDRNSLTIVEELNIKESGHLESGSIKASQTVPGEDDVSILVSEEFGLATLFLRNGRISFDGNDREIILNAYDSSFSVLDYIEGRETYLKIVNENAASDTIIHYTIDQTPTGVFSFFGSFVNWVGDLLYHEPILVFEGQGPILSYYLESKYQVKVVPDSILTVYSYTRGGNESRKLTGDKYTAYMTGSVFDNLPKDFTNKGYIDLLNAEYGFIIGKAGELEPLKLIERYGDKPYLNVNSLCSLPEGSTTTGENLLISQCSAEYEDVNIKVGETSLITATG